MTPHHPSLHHRARSSVLLLFGRVFSVLLLGVLVFGFGAWDREIFLEILRLLEGALPWLLGALGGATAAEWIRRARVPKKGDENWEEGAEGV